MRRVVAIVVLMLALIPSAWLAARWRSMPQLGLNHDDAIYWVSAKSLAEGHGYRIASLPGEPWQTKYPPVLPLLLAAVWKLSPAFPANLPLATLFLWLALPVYVLLTRAILRQFELREWECLLLTAAAALNPMACLLGTVAMSELLFTVFLLASIFLAERTKSAAAGALAGVAYLTRSAALPLLGTVPFCYALKRRWKAAAWFAAAMLPAIAGWQWWVASHLPKARDFVTLYYTNYAGFQNYNVGLADIPRVVWFNLDALIISIGKLLTFNIALFDNTALERVAAVAAIAGAVRLVRRSGKIQYAAAGAAMCAMMLVWHYQPVERFVLPLFPLLAAGLWIELKNFFAAAKTRPARIVAGSALAAIALVIGAGYGIGDFMFLPRLMQACEISAAHNRAAYAWIERNTPPDAALYAYEDPLLYLYTGRHATGLPVPAKLIY